MGPETLLRETAPLATAPRRRLPIGAEALPEGGVHFRVWAPRHRELSIDIERLGSFALAAEPEIVKTISEMVKTCRGINAPC